MENILLDEKCKNIKVIGKLISIRIPSFNMQLLTSIDSDREVTGSLLAILAMLSYRSTHLGHLSSDFAKKNKFWSLGEKTIP